jgi:signal transduction histidine kinase
MLTRDDLIGILNGSVYYLLAGGAAGVVTRTIDRSRAQVDAATEVAMRAREREGRMAEREALARRIHDSVLQAMADIHREGIELAREPAVSAQKVRRLAELAAEQERELRSILIREPEQAPSGMASLRAALEAAAQGRPGLKVVVTATGPIWLATRTVEELREAVKQALDNVTEHAEASRVAVFADIEDGQLEVSVRDDGRGFVYSEEFLRASNKAGMLKSMKGRVEELGGRMRVHSAVGVGTEVEFRIPVPERSDRA